MKKETYADLYNIPGPSDTSIIQTIPITQTDGIECNILKERVATALHYPKEGKTAGFDGISTEEIYEGCSDSLLLQKFHVEVRDIR